MKKMNKKGFTLIELLAVIVILGLLMAIAIPSVTKYINQSRKKTLAGTIANYIQAVSVEVNNGDYSAIGISDKRIYAIPIDCVALEKGGQKTPFGEWFVEKYNGTSWVSSGNAAYVFVQYDGENSYKYQFAFKDSGGYGMKATNSNDINADAIGTSSDYSLPAGAVVLVPGTAIGVTGEGQNAVYTCKRAN